MRVILAAENEKQERNLEVARVYLEQEIHRVLMGVRFGPQRVELVIMEEGFVL